MEMTVTNELIDSLLADYKKPEDLIGENGLLKLLTKKLVERALQAEMAEHLGHAKNDTVANPAGNTRNGKSKKTLKGDFGELPIEIPRDRHGSFEPQIVTKHQTRWAGFDEKILSLYARCMTVREIQSHLEEMYGAEVSPTLISSVTDAVMDEAKTWQARPLDALYPIVYLDCIHVKTRDAGAVRVKAVYPKTAVQLCLVHMVRHSLNYVSWKLRKAVAADLKAIYAASTVDEAAIRLNEFDDKWGTDYPTIVKSWRSNWARITPFFDYPPEIRRIIYTTNAIESVNMGLRKITKNRGSFPSDDALLKLFYLALSNISKKWTTPLRDWKAALTRFTIQFEERMPKT